MKTKLLRKVRKRYQIDKVKVETWMKDHKILYWRFCYEYKNEDGYCFIVSDKHDGFGYKTKWFYEYCEAVEDIRRKILNDYEKYGTRRKSQMKTKIEKVWHI